MPPPPTTLSLPPEVFADAPLDRAALARRYGFTAEQLAAVEALRPFRAEWAAITAQSFASEEQAAAAVYALVERAFVRTPALRESLELGGTIYRKPDGRWAVGLPNFGVGRNSIGTGSVPALAQPVADGSYFWHTHPSARPGTDQVVGFSFTDLLSALRTGRGMFVYQHGRPYRLDIGDAWRAMRPAERAATERRLTALADTVRSDGASLEDRRAALTELRQLLRNGLVRVTVFDRTGVNPSAGQRVPVMAVFLWSRSQGAIELAPALPPLRPLGSAAE